jgi:hypothetical protein
MQALLKQNEHALKALRAMADTRRLVSALAFDGQYPSRDQLVRVGAFAFYRRTEATSAYLTLVGIPQTSAQIAAALARGNVKTGAADDLKAQYATMARGQVTGRFRRWGTRHWVCATPAERHGRLRRKGGKAPGLRLVG